MVESCPLLLFLSNVSNSKEKTNEFFVQQCQTKATDSISFLRFQQIKYTIDARIRDFDNDCRKSLKLIDGLNPNKPHGCGDMSVRMLKFNSIVIQL